ncbi:MAG: ABC transporter permease subunit [Micromonosporaceae bacterium]|nr:ABC transporter permease subunit [Micromonosporaceae bacterium]
MRTVLLIAAKDLRQRIRDRSVLLFALALPLGLAVVFSLILGDLDDGSEVFEYAVLDQDGGPIAAGFTDQVLPAVADSGAITVRPVASADEGRQLVADGEVAALFVVPAGFSATVESGAPATLAVVGDPDATFGVQVARAIAESYTAQLQSVRLSVATATAGEPADPERLAALAGEAAAQPSPVQLADAAADRRELDSKTYMSAGMAVFFLFFTVQFGVSSLLDERADGTMARLLAAPIRRGAIFAAKALTSFVIGVASMAVLAGATSLLLGARWGNPYGVAVLIVAGVLAATGVMAVVASLANTAELAGNWQSIIAVVLGVLGGVFFPVSQVSGGLSTLSYLTPHRWFLRGLADLAGGGGVGVVWLPAGAMLLFAAVTGAVAVLRTSQVVRP